jgi:uncharacterized membrane protein YsdA (DUF1294 family)
MRNKYTRKNNILSALLGCSIGCILTGINFLHVYTLPQFKTIRIVSIVMIVVGVVWISLFTYVNRKVLFRFN